MKRGTVDISESSGSPAGLQNRDCGDAKGTLKVIVRSRKVVVRVDRVRVSSPGLAQAYTSERYVPVFDYLLDDEQLTILEESRGFACRAGLTLEVTDVTRQNPLKRLALRLSGIGVGAVDTGRQLALGNASYLG